MVYVYGMERVLDEVILGLFEKPLQNQRNINNPDFIFDTLNLEDTRLNPKLEIFGYDNGVEQIAIDLSLPVQTMDISLMLVAKS